MKISFTSIILKGGKTALKAFCTRFGRVKVEWKLNELIKSTAIITAATYR
ncbi:MAG: hypothetical protein ACYSWY_05555 [Planctomycetota bacterium]